MSNYKVKMKKCHKYDEYTDRHSNILLGNVLRNELHKEEKIEIPVVGRKPGLIPVNATI